jgi:hypothetical protein
VVLIRWNDSFSVNVSDWLQNHIKGVDMKYGPFFNENGLK